MKRLLVTLVLLVSVLASWPAFAGKTEALLAVSWQPAFCEGHQSKRECQTQSDVRYDASHFSLHGLWPMRSNYCGVSEQDRQFDKAGQWQSLPMVHLEPATLITLEKLMPGVMSDLHRHEWIKHGTCSGLQPEAYFARSLNLVKALNNSAVAELFSQNLGRLISAKEVQQAFNSAFGMDAADRVKMKCVMDGKRQLIVEFTIGLSRYYGYEATLGELIQGAGGTSFGCDGGIVDSAGLQ